MMFDQNTNEIIVNNWNTKNQTIEKQENSKYKEHKSIFQSAVTDVMLPPCW
jgi:hypothetical protein